MYNALSAASRVTQVGTDGRRYVRNTVFLWKSQIVQIWSLERETAKLLKLALCPIANAVISARCDVNVRKGERPCVPTFANDKSPGIDQTCTVESAEAESRKLEFESTTTTVTAWR